MLIFANIMAHSVLITGASGFIGSFIAEEALRQGMKVSVALRDTSSTAYLPDEQLHVIRTDLNNAERLTESLGQYQFDYVIHAAGVTKCEDNNDFYRVNTDGTRNLCEALRKTQENLKHFVFLSSLSVMGNIREKQPHQPIKADDTPHPNTHYAKSKLKAEQEVRNILQGIPYTILRPTGVYGPREKDYFLMAKSIKQHIDFAVGYRRQHITFIYVKDLVQAVFIALNNTSDTNTFLLTDGETYDSTTFSKFIQKELGVRHCLRIKAPLWILRLACTISESIARRQHKSTTLNTDKYHILKQRNWMADITPAIEILGYHPQYKLAEGVEETIAWYKEEKWL